MDGWTVLLLYLVMYGDQLEIRNREAMRRSREEELFQEYADRCPYLEIENYGRAEHRICRHPVRDDPSDWVMCFRAPCPSIAANATQEDMRTVEEMMVRDSLNTGGRQRYPCEGCIHFEWVPDMGSHLPRCKLYRKFDPTKCDRYELPHTMT